MTATNGAAILVHDRQPPQDIKAEEAMLGAMLVDERAVVDVLEIVKAEDLYSPAHQTIFSAAADLHHRGERPDAITVAAELDRRGDLIRVGGAPVLHTLMTKVITAANAAYYAERVVETAQRRSLVEAGQRLVQLGHEASQDTAALLSRARQTLDAAAVVADPAAVPRALELDDFLALDVPDHDWLVPGLLERGDRLIVTAAEGGGKSTLLRQMGVQAAAGIHPFDGDPFKALRVLIVDLENSAAQVNRKLRPLRQAAGLAYGGGLQLHVRPQGLDLLAAGDAAWLRSLVADARPDILITGPLYRLAGGDPTEEMVAKAVSSHLDHLRVEFGCAVVLEAHTPYGNNGGKRPERPYGASLWSRWPEFGVFLDGGTGQLRHWRGARDERDWPALLKRGGEWPWTAVTTAREVVWAKVVEHCIQVGGRPSLRKLAEAIGEPYSAVQRTTQDHPGEWEAMA